MFDVKPGPCKGSECLMLSVGQVRVSELMESLGPVRGQNV